MPYIVYIYIPTIYYTIYPLIIDDRSVLHALIGYISLCSNVIHQLAAGKVLMHLATAGVARFARSLWIDRLVVVSQSHECWSILLTWPCLFATNPKTCWSICSQNCSGLPQLNKMHPIRCFPDSPSGKWGELSTVAGLEKNQEMNPYSI